MLTPGHVFFNTLSAWPSAWFVFVCIGFGFGIDCPSLKLKRPNASAYATIDYIVLFIYFAVMAGIGFWLMRKQKRQEDFFMGGRSFGKLMQTFAAFGAGTGSADPVNTARGTFNNGMSGMWGVMYWLFVTPVYWISAVWYRRMRCLTLGDWFVERYESKKIGVAYALFGCFYYMVYGAMLFTAIGKVAAPLMGDTLWDAAAVCAAADHRGDRHHLRPARRHRGSLLD